MAEGATTSRRSTGPARSAGAWTLLLRQYDYWATAYRRTWRGTIVTSFLTPLLYVVAMGVLLGGFIPGDPARLEGAHTYLAFVAPGLVAAQSMQTAVAETTYPIMGALKWSRTYFGMHATPLRPVDILNGTLAFLGFRLLTTTGVFSLVMAPFGVFTTLGGALGAWLTSTLVGFAVGTAVCAYSVGAQSEQGFPVVFRVGVIPQFLFSGAFFPIAGLPAPLEWLARITPLWQGVDLTRTLALGTTRPVPALVHVAYLVVLTLVAHRIGCRRLTRRLER